MGHQYGMTQTVIPYRVEWDNSMMWLVQLYRLELYGTPVRYDLYTYTVWVEWDTSMVWLVEL